MTPTLRSTVVALLSRQTDISRRMLARFKPISGAPVQHALEVCAPAEVEARLEKHGRQGGEAVREALLSLGLVALRCRVPHAGVGENGLPVVAREAARL